MLYLSRPSQSGQPPFRAAVSVPKKLFKKAVDRNHIKRQLREAIRLNQQLIPIKEDRILNFMLIFIGKDLTGSQQIQTAVRFLFNKLVHDA